MEKLKAGLIRFMYGRNGPDTLYRDSIILYIVIAVINVFLDSAIIALLLTVLFGFSLFRVLSRNVYKRQQENIKYLQLKEKALKKIRMTKTILTDKEHHYHKCKDCKNILRLPRRKGVHTAVCPICRKSIKIKIR